ncbi:MAG: hypothetical protein WBA00_11480 [Rhodococcus sp. (in: high G+C Gram-positive bacteria)]
MQDVDPQAFSTAGNVDMQQALEGIRGNLFLKLLGGFLNIPSALGSLLNDIGLAITAAPGAIVGGVLGAINSFISGIKIQGDQTATTVAVEIPRLDNRIDEVSVGGASAQRASFFQDGTWTKPTGYSRHVVKIIGGASGGGRSNSIAGGSGVGGWAGGCNEFEFFDSDLPATVACSIGLGGAGATSDGTPGSGGLQSSFGVYGAAGGATTSAHGFGEKTRPLRGGNGGASANGQTFAASAGTGHGFGNGGVAGTPTGSGEPGGAGNRPTPNTLSEYGTAGGGGAAKGGTGSGGRGGDGAVPGAPGGGGGAYTTFGIAGNGGNGAPGAIFITSYK